MARGFLSGMIWGTVFGAFGAAAYLLSAELPAGGTGPGDAGGASSRTETPALPPAEINIANVAPAPNRRSADAPEIDNPEAALNAPETAEAAPALPEESGAGQSRLAVAVVPQAPAGIEAPEIETDRPPRLTPGAGQDGAAAPEDDTAVSGDGLAETPEAAEIAELLPDVTTDSLPELAEDGGNAAETETTEQEQIAEALPETRIPPGNALEQNAVSFENREGKPLYAIILIDTPDGALPPGAAGGLGFPLTIAVDASTPEAGERAAAYRAAGHEVLLLLSLPDGATPADMEVAFESATAVIPGAVGVLDLPEGGFGSNHILTRQLVSILARSGHGLIGYGRGLDATGPLAQRDNVPSALAFRIFDDERQAPPTIHRYLDRAAFRAQQQGHVVMVGHMYPESVRAMMEWVLQERAASMAIAPASAVMRVN